MSGITFFKTDKLQELKEFYQKRIGATLWKDQGQCLIFEKQGFRIGFCSSDGAPETCGILTFVYDSKKDVDRAYQSLKDIAKDEPVSRRPDFDIYQFFAEDPEGRTLEFQCFLGNPE